jgi:hypothetical protein
MLMNQQPMLMNLQLRQLMAKPSRQRGKVLRVLAVKMLMNLRTMLMNLQLKQLMAKQSSQRELDDLAPVMLEILQTRACLNRLAQRHQANVACFLPMEFQSRLAIPQLILTQGMLKR